MSLIYRQAAIDALDEYFGRIGKLKRRGLTKGERAISLDVVGAIRTLPSAQVVDKDICVPSNDCINRQSAINIVYFECGEWEGLAKTIVKDINNLPSAQPEIIRCKDCKWKNNHNCTRAVEVWIDDNKYCAWAERRTDE